MNPLISHCENLLADISPQTNQKLVFIKKNQLNNLQEYICKDQLELKYGG